MTAADLNRFLVLCSLVPDLHCPGYSSTETLSKEANLMVAASRYKVDAAKLTADVKAALSTKRKRAGSKARTSNGLPKQGKRKAG